MSLTPKPADGPNSPLPSPHFKQQKTSMQSFDQKKTKAQQTSIMSVDNLCGNTIDSQTYYSFYEYKARKR